MDSSEKVLGWLHGEIKTPPFSEAARREAGWLLRCLQRGKSLPMPQSRPMPSVGSRCHELRIKDASGEWRIIYRIDPDAILVLDVFQKKTRETPPQVLKRCKRRLRKYDVETEE